MTPRRRSWLRREFSSLRQWQRSERRFLRKHLFVLFFLTLLIILRISVTLASFDAFQTDAGCKPTEATHSGLENRMYRTAMGFKLPVGEARHVALVTITEGIEPLEVINNTCENRRFISSLVHELDLLGAKVIAVDQSYSIGSCNVDTINDTFRTALEGAHAPLIVGEKTHKRSDQVEGGDCLIEDPQFRFMTSSAGAASSRRENVTFGSLVLNADVRKIPLTWPVFPSISASENQKLTTVKHNGFSYDAAQQADSTILQDKNIQYFVANDEHPFTSFVQTFPTWSAMDILCYGPGKTVAGHPEWGACENIPHTPFNFDGKVIVVGDHIESDFKPGDGGHYGMDLQAEYIEALLDRRYVGTVPWYVDDGAIVLFVLLAVLCEAMSVRRTPTGEEVMDPFRLAVILTGAVLLLGFTAWVVLQFFNRFMPDLLLAFISMFSGLIGTFSLATFFKFSRKYPLPTKK